MLQKLLSLFALWSIPLSGLIAAQWEVCSACQYSTLQSAIDVASAGDTVIVREGRYSEHGIFVNKPLLISGINMPVIDGKNEGEILTVISDSVTIEGLRIENVGISYTKDHAGIRVRRSKDFVIRGNQLYNTFFGIYIEHSHRGIISGNSVVGEATQEMSSGNAIHLWYCEHIEVTGNDVSGHRDGIYFEFVDSSKIHHNTSSDNLRYGLHFMFSNDDIYTDNVFRNNGAGVAVMFSKEIDMYRNTFSHNWGPSSYGLLLKEIYDAEIRYCTFDQNSIGVYVEGSTRIEYRENTFRRNGWALKISGGCLDNVVSQNNFIANTFDLSLSSNANNNTFDHNYWSAYSGYDLDKDGIGDVPYRPVKLFNYIVNQTPETIVLLRSLFVDIVNFSEKVSPVFTPKDVLDEFPRMKKINFNQKMPHD